MEFIDIEKGKLLRLEGWVFKDGEFDFQSYRDDDQDWEEIKMEGYFVEPHNGLDLHDGFDLIGWIKNQTNIYYKDGYLSKDVNYIIFLIPQDCESLIAGDNYPEDKEDWSADDMDDLDGITKTFIIKDNSILPLSFYKTLEMLGKTWEEALETNTKWFL